MQEIWDNYLTSTHVKGVVFTLDLSNPATMAGGGLALCELLQVRLEKGLGVGITRNA